MHLLRDMSRRVSRRKGFGRLEAESRHPTRTLLERVVLLKTNGHFMDGKFGTQHISVSQTPGDQSQEMIWQAPLDGCQLRWEFPCPATKRGPKPKAGRKQKVRYRAIEDGKFRKRRVVKLEGSGNGQISESRYWSEAMEGEMFQKAVFEFWGADSFTHWWKAIRGKLRKGHVIL